ncbi:MAG: hypothetical protein WB952_21930 [Terriglobales bacterium]
MKSVVLRSSETLRRTHAAILAVTLLALFPASLAQTTPYERTFPESPAQVEKALKGLQSSAGRLPVLDGFVVPGNHPLERYQRGYYQCTVQVNPSPGGSVVRISAKITAWYADSDPSRAGYQVLASNGRIESDLLDRLGDALNSKISAAAEPPSSVRTAPAKSKAQNDPPVPTISAPMPRDTVRGEPIGGSKKAGPSSPFTVGTPASEEVASLETRKAVADKHVEDLEKQAKSLEEILRNQAHPTNLAAVKKANTPILGSPSEGAKVLFLASAEDEFEMLDINPEWVHVRISGLSRGWIRRSSLEMSSSPTTEVEVPEKPVETAPAGNTSANTGPPFQVENEQIASFPGDWGPLRGKTVKIISVQKARAAGTGSQAKLDFAKSVFDREYAELTKTSSTTAGVVVIFDSEDGGMLAATLPVLQLWKTGNLSDEAFWRRCYFDPPEMFSPSGQ